METYLIVFFFLVILSVLISIFRNPNSDFDNSEKYSDTLESSIDESEENTDETLDKKDYKLEMIEERENDEDYDTGTLENIEVAGIYYLPNVALDEIEAHGKVGRELWLEREPRNKYDENAVRVKLFSRKIGYVPREEAEFVAELMDRGAIVYCTISKIMGTRLLPTVYFDIRYAVRKFEEGATMTFKEAKEKAIEMEKRIKNYRTQQKRQKTTADNNRVLGEKKREETALSKLEKFKEAEKQLLEEYNKHCRLYHIYRDFK